MSDLDDRARPLAGKTVVIVHPAWHSCGSHQVFVSQAKAYRALGAAVYSLALNDEPAVGVKKQRETYFAATADLVADGRFWSAMPLATGASPAMAAALLRRLRGDHARLRVAVAQRVPVPAEIAALPRIDLIHCNHFFCMPVATRLRAGSGTPIVLDTHDIQARQYETSNETSWTLPPTIGFDEMMATERAEMVEADILVHLNDDEAAAFRALLPEKRHELVYPAVEATPPGGDGPDLVIVAAANYANFRSVEWFLREVVPLAPDLPIRIVGTIEIEMRRQAPDLLKAHAALFTGRVDDPDKAYERAAAILLPTVSGHGISIKTIEALSSGAPLIATSHAFRGMKIDPTALANVSLADDAEAFAAALRATAIWSPLAPAERRFSDTRRLYEQLFSPDAYRRALARIIGPLMTAGSSRKSI